jgi:hypothetical protein
LIASDLWPETGNYTSGTRLCQAQLGILAADFRG